MPQAPVYLEARLFQTSNLPLSLLLSLYLALSNFPHAPVYLRLIVLMAPIYLN